MALFQIQAGIVTGGRTHQNGRVPRLPLGWVNDVRISAGLGHRWRDRARLAAFHARVVLGTRFPRLRPAPAVVRLGPDGHGMEVASPGELTVMRGVFVDREYESRTDAPKRVIFDLGANIGLATLFLQRRHPQARIVSVEADHRTHGRLVANVGDLPGVTVLHRAVAGADGPVRFYPARESIGSSVVPRRGSLPPVDTPGSTVASLMREVGVDRVDLLKIDIEGAEFEALRQTPLDRVGEIIVEVHYDLGPGDDEIVRDLLRDFRLDFKPLPAPGRFLVHGTR